jgi:hypothetical protein
VGAVAVSLSRAGPCTSGKKRKALSTSHWITTASLSLRTNASTNAGSTRMQLSAENGKHPTSEKKTCTNNYTGV